MPELRVGCGYDVHAFGTARPLILAGVQIPHDCGLAGTSDADVVTHAIIDALLGAAAWGDIGTWFPSDDPRYYGASSLALLDQVVQELARHGWRVNNVDATVIAQRPRLGPHRDTMRAALAEHLRLDARRVSVKATTPDHLGAIGRAEGIAAQAVVLLEAPN